MANDRVSPARKAAEDITCPKCFAEPDRKCYYINRAGNHTYLQQLHKERIEAACSQTVAPGDWLQDFICIFPDWKPSAFVMARLKDAYTAGFLAQPSVALGRDAEVCPRCEGHCNVYDYEAMAGPAQDFSRPFDQDAYVIPCPACQGSGRAIGVNVDSALRSAAKTFLMRFDKGDIGIEYKWEADKIRAEADALRKHIETEAAPPAVSTPRCPKCGGLVEFASGKIGFQVVLCVDCRAEYPADTLQQCAQFFQPASQPSPALCRYSVGQSVTWQGQQGRCSGVITKIIHPENSGYVLLIGEDEFPICEDDVQPDAQSSELCMAYGDTGWKCSRGKGHTGDHEAYEDHDPTSELLESWPSQPSPEGERANERN